MKLIAIFITILISASSLVLADVNWFKYPRRHSVYGSGDDIAFVVDDVSNDYDDHLRAVLYDSDGTEIKELGVWRGSEVSGDEDFTFTWSVDVEQGQYFVRVFEVEQEDDDDYPGDNDGEEDDINRSYLFEVGDSSYYDNNNQDGSYNEEEDREDQERENQKEQEQREIQEEERKLEQDREKDREGQEDEDYDEAQYQQNGSSVRSSSNKRASSAVLRKKRSL